MSIRGSGSQVVLVVGANGGCGASMVAGGLALWWARTVEATWLLELDLGRGDRAEAWGLGHERTLDDLIVVAGELDAGHLRSAAHDGGDGLRLVMAAATPARASAWTPEAVGRLVAAAGVAAGVGGRVVLDAGLGATGSALAAGERSDSILAVCSPTIAAARRAHRLMEALSGAASRCGLVVNHGPGTGEIGARALGRAVGAPIVAELPWSRREGDRLAAGRWPSGRRLRLAPALRALAGALG